MKIKFKKISIICIFFLVFGMLGCTNKSVDIMKSEEYNKEAGTLKAPKKPKEPKKVADVKSVNEVKDVVAPNKPKEPKQVEKPKEVQVEESGSSVLPSEPIEYNPILNEPVESSHTLNEALEPIENKVEPNSPVMIEH